MKKFATTILTFALAAVMVAPLMAEDGKKKKRKKGKRKARVRSVVRLPKKVRESLNDDQKKKVGALNKEYAPKVLALFKERNEILTDDQKAAIAKVRKEARASKKKGKELRQALANAVQLSEEQKKKQKAIQGKQRALQGEIRNKLKEILTEEQFKQIRGGGRKKGKKKRKKKDAAE